MQLADRSEPFDESFIQKVFKGELKDGEIDSGYYFRVANKLTEAVAKGLGGNSFKATDYRNSLKAHLEHNIFAFSAAKSFEALETYKSKLSDEKGDVVSYGRFRDSVTEVDVEFNDNWLRTEYNSAVSIAQASDKWQSLSAHEYLEYRTVGDDRVRKSHAALDGKVFHKDDPILDKIYPPNDFGCRCTMLPAAQGAKANTYTEVQEAVGAANIKPYFQRNAGKSKMVFDGSHPYFQKMTAKGLKTSELSATKNYNLRTPEQIYKRKEELPEINPITADEAKAWFNKNAKNGVIELAAKDGLNVQLDKSFYDKMIASPNPEYAQRTGYVHKVMDVLHAPDEIWSHYHNGKLQTSFIKYYKDKPYMAAIKEKNGRMEFETFFRVDKDGIIEQRRSGVLKYRK